MRFEVRSEIAPIGQNPEAAELNNPHGYYYGEVHYVIVTDEHGNRQKHFATAVPDRPHKGTHTLAQLQALAEKLNRLQPKLDPNLWSPTHPEYGSQAYLDAEPEIVWAERQADLRGW